MATDRCASVAQTAAVFAGGLAAGVGSVFLAQKALGNKQSSTFPALGPIEFIEKAAPRSIAPSRCSLPASQAKDQSSTKLTTPTPSAQSLSAVDLDNRTVVGATGVEQELAAPESPTKHTDAHASLLAEQVTDAVHDSPLWVSRPLNASTAIGLVERLAYNGSDVVFVYDSEATAFGRWVEAAGVKGVEAAKAPKVYSLETRAGAATAVLGYLSGTSTSASPDGPTASILTNAQGLITMAPALTFSQSAGRVVVQVSSAGQRVLGTGEGDVRLVDDAASTLLAGSLLAEGESDWTLIYTSTQAEAADVAAASYKATSGNVAHVFDGVFSGREVDQSLAVSSAIDNVSGETVTDVLSSAQWEWFAYTGPASPEVVLVVPNTSVASAAKLAYSRLDAKAKAQTAVLAVRVVRPWNDAALQAAVPSSTKRIVVLDLDQGTLAANVESSFFEEDKDVSSLSAPADAGSAEIAAALSLLLSGSTTWAEAQVAAKNVGPAPVSTTGKLLTVLDTEVSATTYAGHVVARIFSDAAAAGVGAAKALSCRSLQRFDNFHGPQAAGVARSDIVFGPRTLPVATVARDGQAQTVVLAQAGSITSALDTLSLVSQGSTALLDTSGWDAPASEVISERLAPVVQRTIAKLDLKLIAINVAAIVAKLEATTAAGDAKAKQESIDSEVASVILAVAALQVHLNTNPSTLTTLVRPTLSEIPGVNVDYLVSLVKASVAPVSYDVQAFAAAKEEEGKSVPNLPSWEYTGFSRLADRSGAVAEPVARSTSWASAAFQRLYPEAYDLEAGSLRADLAPEKLWEVTVTENRRLTPLDYDRNVFHLEMSTKGTDLKYEVGEALGVHGWNDEGEVREFLQWTGFQPNEVISVPLANGKAESITIFQLLLQRKDIFGRPGKSFYAVLADKAANANEAKWLRFVASAEGNSTFKKYAELETLTYADILRMFPSVLVNFTINDILAYIEDIQPRHYSIASAQAAVGDSVHLLIVTVDWKTPSGSPRYGQCTRYLSKLRPGDKVTVSVRPSVMKLPPRSDQPIIMAGLGTGAAPFRAFLQARALQKQQGLPIGPLVYYFGSRYRSKEYLYGEELEAFLADGLLTRLGLAFSRDQKHKIYIQDRISQDADIMSSYLAPEIAAANGEVKVESLAEALIEAEDKDKGYFYLCGPTWPVPDITEAVLSSLEKLKGLTRPQAEEHLEKLKEDERWVLEVY